MSGPWRRDIQERIDRQNAMKAGGGAVSADRLREAADRLDEISIGWDGTPFPDRAAEAALLRVIADEHPVIRHPYGVDLCASCDEAWPCVEGAAALTLADTVLRGVE